MGPVLSFLGAVFFGVAAGASAGYVLAVNIARFALLSLASKFLAPKIDLQQTARDKMFTAKSAIQPQAYVYGQDMLTGPLIFANVSGDANQYLHRLVALTGREIEDFVGFRIDDTNITIGTEINSRNATVKSGDFADVVLIETQLGTSTQTVLSQLNTDFSSLWTTAHRCRGWSLLYTRMEIKGGNKAFEKGVPQNLRALVKGHKVYDPRLDSTYEYSSGSNLVKYSEDLTTGLGWAGATLTRTADVANDPNGDATLDRLAPNTAFGNARYHLEQDITFSVDTNYILSAVVKSDGCSHAWIGMQAGSGYWFGVTIDLTTGSVNQITGASGGTIAASGSVDLGGGLWRVYVAGDCDLDGDGHFTIGVCDSASPTMSGFFGVPQYTPTAGEDLIAGWCQMEVGTTLGTYVKTEATTQSGVSGSGAHRVATPSTWEWSENPALCLADWLMWDEVGISEESDRIDWNLVWDAADICDELVVVPPDTSPATTQKRYTCNFTFFADQERGQVKKILEDAMLGRCIFSQGKWRMYAGAALTPTITLSENNLAGGIQLEASTAAKQRYNTVRGKFVDPTRDYHAVAYPEQTVAAYVTDDNGEVKYRTTDFNACNNSYECQRNAIKIVRQSRNQKIMRWEGNWSCFPVQVGHVVNVNLAELGWNATDSPPTTKKFLCTEWSLDQEGKGVNLTLVEENDSVWTDPAVGDYTVRTATGTLQPPALLAVSLSDATIENAKAAPVYAGVRAGADGRLRYGNSSNVYYDVNVPLGEWLNTGSDSYEIRATVISGSLASGTEDTWLALDQDRTWFCANDSTVSPSYVNDWAIVTLEITNDSSASPVPILASADYTLLAGADNVGEVWFDDISESSGATQFPSYNLEFGADGTIYDGELRLQLNTGSGFVTQTPPSDTWWHGAGAVPAPGTDPVWIKWNVTQGAWDTGETGTENTWIRINDGTPTTNFIYQYVGKGVGDHTLVCNFQFGRGLIPSGEVDPPVIGDSFTCTLTLNVIA